MGNFHRIVSKWLFALREEDPRRRSTFLLGLRAEILVRVVPKQRWLEKELKTAGDKNENGIWTFQQNYHYNHLVVTPNGMVHYAI